MAAALKGDEAWPMNYIRGLGSAVSAQSPDLPGLRLTLGKTRADDAGFTPSELGSTTTSPAIALLGHEFAGIQPGSTC
jgi:hypothetical protein